MVDFAGIESDESIVAWMAVSFAGSSGTSVRGALSLRPEHARRQALNEWARAATACGFPYAGGDMIVGVSDRQRLHVWKPRAVRVRPGRHRGAFPIARIAQIGLTSHGATLRMTMLIDDGTMLAVESMHRKRLRTFAARIESAVGR